MRYDAGGGPGDARVAEPLARLDALDHAGRAVNAAVPVAATTGTALDTLLPCRAPVETLLPKAKCMSLPKY